MKKVIQLLNENRDVHEWKMVIAKRHSTELFFIRNQLEMNRAKDVTHIIITVYKIFEENQKKYRGSAIIKLNISDTLQDMKKKINDALFAASFVKNEYYPLPTSENNNLEKIVNFSHQDSIEEICEAVQQIYKENTHYEAFINSTEFFVTNSNVHIYNSNGLNVSYNHHICNIEIVTEAKGKYEAIEVKDSISFGKIDKGYLTRKIRDQLRFTELRQKAIPMPNISNLPVIIRGEELSKFWEYYLFKVSAAQKYGKIHQNDIGTNIQGEDIIGDKITIWIKPFLENSSNNSPYDTDGFYLEDTLLIEKGIIKRLYATYRYAHYLGLQPTGEYRNICVSGGSLDLKEVTKKPHLEIISFSSFQTDAMTGSFGGEFRLGIYFDGEKYIPVTLGTVTGKVDDEQKEMYFTKETRAFDKVVGPEKVLFTNMTIIGETK